MNCYILSVTKMISSPSTIPASSITPIWCSRGSGRGTIPSSRRRISESTRQTLKILNWTQREDSFSTSEKSWENREVGWANRLIAKNAHIHKARYTWCCRKICHSKEYRETVLVHSLRTPIHYSGNKTTARVVMKKTTMEIPEALEMKTLFLNLVKCLVPPKRH